jgi:hypothetical protein
MDRIVAVLNQMRGGLDDDYSLFESGKILHQYDRHLYKGGLNRQEELTASQISNEIKHHLLNKASEEDKELVKKLLEIN